MSPRTAEPDLTCDAFLGGALMLWQPATGYRAGVDPVLLAAACPARAGETVLELGCGVGTAALCLAHRVQGIFVTGVERQPRMADIARRNARETGLPLEVVTADLSDLPAGLRQRRFHHVITNPPYFDRSTSVPSGHSVREAALGEATSLALWLEVAARRLLPKGWLTMIHRPERLDDILAGIAGRLGSVTILPLVPRAGRDAGLILVRARKEGRAPLRLCSSLTMHDGEHHESDAEDYSPELRAVLRDGAALSAFKA